MTIHAVVSRYSRSRSPTDRGATIDAVEGATVAGTGTDWRDACRFDGESDAERTVCDGSFDLGPVR